MSNNLISIRIKEHIGGREYSFEVRKGRLLMDLIKKELPSFVMPCGGRGWCGGCRVRFVLGAPKASAADMARLSAADISNGIRLACRAVPDRDCEIELLADLQKEHIYSPDEYESAASCDESVRENNEGCNRTGYTKGGNNAWIERFDGSDDLGLAIDLGTTTIALAIVDPASEDGGVIAYRTTANSQRKYGFDVISRIEAARDHGDELQKLVRQDIAGLLQETLRESGIDAGRLKIGVLAGNTTMLHLLRGYDVSGLGFYPYTPVSLQRQELTLGELLGQEMPPGDAVATELLHSGVFVPERIAMLPVTVLPGFSSFVGADITAGLYGIRPDKPFIFLDLGTNGEMAAGDADHIYVASAAAGPVFEGGGISCGCPSVEGAICHIDDGGYETIMNAAPVGLCGSGVLELVSMLLRKGIIDKSGLLSDEFFEKGYYIKGTDIYITQKDIRNLQLGKAAISAGLRILARRMVSERAISLEGADLYIAGGFGSGLDPEAIRPLGLIPGDVLGESAGIHAEPVGNACLRGSVRFLRDLCRDREGAIVRLEALVEMSSEVALASDSDFESVYIESVDFG